MKTLVLIEHDGIHIRKASLSALTAAQAFNAPIDVMVFIKTGSSAVDQLKQISAVAKILTVSVPNDQTLFAEDIVETMKPLAHQYTTILAAATTFGKNAFPRLAACLDVGQISDVTRVINPTTFERPIYAGNAIATISTTDPIVMATIRTTAFTPIPLDGMHATAVENVTFNTSPLSAKMSYLGLDSTPQDRPDLNSARVVVSGGRALGSADNFHLIEKLADCLEGAVGASRAAVDAGFAPNDYQVGQTGKVVAPELYIAVGLSGAAQHLAGMKESKIIVAINTDPEAPICQVADYTYVADLFEAVPALIQELCK